MAGRWWMKKPEDNDQMKCIIYILYFVANVTGEYLELPPLFDWRNDEAGKE